VRQTNSPHPFIDTRTRASEEAPLCIPITHCFFSQTPVYIASHPGHFVPHAPLDSPTPSSVCLTKAHVCTHYAKKAEPDRPFLLPYLTQHVCTHSFYTFCLHYAFFLPSIALTLMLVLQCLIRFSYLFFPPRSQVSALRTFFYRTRNPPFAPFSLYEEPIMHHPPIPPVK
jgi:hypothetical protein